MKLNKLTQVFLLPYLYIIIVLLGVSLKFYQLDRKFFWDDEIATVLHTSGIPMDVYEKNIPVNQVLHKKYFDDLLHLNDRNLSFSDQFFGLSKMPQVTPGHYYYFIFLTRIFGDDYMVFRYFSVFLFLLSIPFLFLLTKKLFKSDLSGWIAISLYTVSPFFQLYAQEARYYMLWSFAIILMHYLFLIASEKQTLKLWLLYIVCGFFAIHTTILFYITLLAHFVYTLIFHKTKWKPLVISQFAIFLTSLPWLIYIFINRADIQQNLSWLMLFGNQNVFSLLHIHFNNFIDLFAYLFKLGLSDSVNIAGRWIYGVLLLIAFYLFFRKANNKQKWFVGLATLLGVICIIALDLIRSTGSSSIARYLLLNFIGLIMLISFVIQKAIEKRAVLFGSLFLIIISIGILSSKAVADDAAFGKRDDAYFHVKDAAQRFSGKEHILIISDFNVVVPKSYTAFLSLTHASTNENIDVIYAKPEYPDFKKNINFNSYDKVYCMYLSVSLLNHLKEIFGSDDFKLIEKRVIYGSFDISLYGIN